MTRTEQIQKLLKILKSDGWVSVYNAQSGIYYKNGYVLVYGDNHDLQKDKVSMQFVYSKFLNEDLLNASDWFIEHDGFVVGLGTITPRLLEACEIGTSDTRYKDWLKQITKIRDTVSCSRSQELQHRMTIGLIETQGNVCKYVSHEGPVRDTLIFKFTKDTDVFNAGQIYRVVNVADGKLQIVNVSGGSEVTSLDPKVYREFEQTGVIVAMESLITVGKVQTKALRPVYNEPVADVPRELFKFKVPNRVLLSKAVASCMNITPLLESNITITSELLDAIASTCEDISPILSLSIDEDGSRTLAPLIRDRLNISRFIQGAVDSGYLQLQLNDFDYEFENFVRDVKFDSVYSGLVREMFSYGIQGIENNVLKQYILWKGRNLGLEDVADALVNDGIFTSTNVFMRWSTVKNRGPLYAFFAATGLVVEDNQWSDWLSKIVNNGMYLAYDIKRGFVLQVGNSWLGRDYNSLVFYDAALNPVWRAIKVNEAYIQYGNFPIKCLVA